MGPRNIMDEMVKRKRNSLPMPGPKSHPNCSLVTVPTELFSDVRKVVSHCMTFGSLIRLGRTRFYKVKRHVAVILNRCRIGLQESSPNTRHTPLPSWA